MEDKDLHLFELDGGDCCDMMANELVACPLREWHNDSPVNPLALPSKT